MSPGKARASEVVRTRTTNDVVLIQVTTCNIQCERPDMERKYMKSDKAK